MSGILNIIKLIYFDSVEKNSCASASNWAN